MGCARGPFLALNGFDYAFPRAGAEDRGFGMRWSESGRHLHSVPDALVDHFNGMDLKSFYAKTGTMLEALTFCMSVWVH